MATPIPQSLNKALDLLARVIEDDGAHPLGDLARDLGLPVSTAHRFSRALEERGLLTRERPGRYLAGPALLNLAHRLDAGRILARLARPELRRLAKRTRQTVHMGVLEGGMVTYLAKEGGGHAAAFTREDMQLEAYCSGIGKVLLAHLAGEERARYLADGPFVALTSQTIVDPAALAIHLDIVRAQAWAIDDAEVFEALKCLAAPVKRPDGLVVAAVSVSAPAEDFDEPYRLRTLEALRETTAAIEARLRSPRAGSDDDPCGPPCDAPADAG